MNDVTRPDDATDTGNWWIRLRFTEDGVRTVAVASLREGERKLQARGSARRSPVDPDLPRVGEDLAASRALSRLAHELLSDAVTRLEAVTHEPAGIRA
jgi:hypothetical protein